MAPLPHAGALGPAGLGLVGLGLLAGAAVGATAGLLRAPRRPVVPVRAPAPGGRA